jgi:hypothetical protein
MMGRLYTIASAAQRVRRKREDTELRPRGPGRWCARERRSWRATQYFPRLAMGRRGRRRRRSAGGKA